MAIKKPVQIADSIDAFVNKANEVVAPVSKERNSTDRGFKKIITVGFHPDLLEKIEVAARASGISRTAYINLVCSRAVAE